MLLCHDVLLLHWSLPLIGMPLTGNATYRHARVVALLDIFELDSCTFATVLELCEGGDLDLHLQRHQVSAITVT